jgi:Condensation domain/TubC N-terminal docking domain
MESTSDILSEFRGRGIHLWLENGQLRYRAPESLVSQDDLARLRSHKVGLLALLAEEHRVAGALRNTTGNPFPLSYSQRSHWNTFNLRNRPAVRQIASVTWLRGKLDEDALGTSIREIVRRHASLRTRVVLVNGEPLQWVDPQSGFRLSTDQLEVTTTSSVSPQIQARIEELIMEPIDIAKGPLFTAQLLRVREREHVLLVVMEHIISDAHSMGVFLAQLNGVYRQLSSNRSIGQTPFEVQFIDYVSAQLQGHGMWIGEHGNYWHDRIDALGPFAQFRADAGLTGSQGNSGWGTITFEWGQEFKTRLTDWSRNHHTTAVTAVLTAFVCAVARWCDENNVVIRYQSDGRTSAQTAEVIGFFASPLYVFLKISHEDTFNDVLKKVVAALCDAHEHSDSCYLETLTPRPRFLQSCAFNWLPQVEGSESRESPASDSELKWEPFTFQDPLLGSLEADSDPVLLLLERSEKIIGRMHFPLRRLSAATTDRFVGIFRSMVERMLCHSETKPATYI